MVGVVGILLYSESPVSIRNVSEVFPPDIDTNALPDALEAMFPIGDAMGIGSVPTSRTK